MLMIQATLISTGLELMQLSNFEKKFMPKFIFYLLIFFLYNESEVYTKSSFIDSSHVKYDLVVAKDGSGNFQTIQEAVNSVKDFSQRRIRIFIKKGVYKEKLIIPTWKTRISLIGENKDSTVITNDDYSGKGGINTFTSYTVLVQGDDFIAENITFENTAGRVGQAVALDVEGDRVIIKNCRILGNQDTLYAGTDNSRQYYTDCYIEGTTDYIFGAATVVFDRCTIKSKTNSYITAASTSKEQKFGFVFSNCNLIAEPGITKVFLGRPWRDYAAVSFIHCYLGDQIVPQGWFNWNEPGREKTSRYSEFQNTGPGSDIKDRVKWSRQLTAEEVKNYNIKKIFTLSGNWEPLKELNN